MADEYLAEFPEEVRESVEGLIYLGELSEEVEFCGHTFGLRTLRAAEEIAAAKAIEPFRNTLAEPQCWMASQIGLALTHVDGDEAFCPAIGPDQTAFARGRFTYVTEHWYTPTIDFLFQAYTKLLEKQSDALEAMLNLSPANRNLFSPLDGSLGPVDITAAEIISKMRS